jgi:hypothetical protein
MAKKRPQVALVYDFDGTLSPGNMQEFGFIQATGKTKDEFWEKNRKFAEGKDANGILTYMYLMLDEAKKNNISLTRESFQKFGKDVELFRGVKQWFSLVNEYGNSIGLDVKHYINSSGLKEMIEGTPIAHEFENIYACSFLYNKEGIAYWPPCSFTIFMQGTSVSPSPKYIIRGKGIGRFSSGIYWFTLLLSLTCLIPLLILKRNCVLVV